MIVRIALVLVGLFHLGNGLAMLIAPMTWYESVPGVTAAGPFNHHFILDIGMAFVMSGSFLVLGARTTAASAYFAIAGATWPLLHSLIHIAGWITNGFPLEPHLMASETIGVVGLSALGGVLAWLRYKGET